MQIKKETVISVLTTNGETINAGDTVVLMQRASATREFTWV